VTGGAPARPTEAELAGAYRRFEAAAEEAFGPPAAPGTRAPHARMLEAANADLDGRLRHMALTEAADPSQVYPRMDTWALIVYQHVWEASRRPGRT